MTVWPHLTLKELFQAAKDTPNPTTARRIQAVAMAQQSLTGAKIAQLTGHSQRNIRRWVSRYNHGGIEALSHQRGAGRKPNFASDQEQAFKDRIEAGPTEKDQVNVFYGKDYQRILEQEFDTLHSLSGVYHLLHRLGYSWLMPRPQHEKSDPAAQEEFKKTL